MTPTPPSPSRPFAAGRGAARKTRAREFATRFEALLGPRGEYFEGSGYWNNGYWETDSRTAREASENLVNRLLAFLPRRSGTILDVACGFGATTRQLLRHFDAVNVTGIDISDTQMEVCRANAPGCSFLRMDATHLGFPDASFDVVLCIEAAFQFDTRHRFLEEARRVLRPGGHLLMSDLLHEPRAEALSRRLHPENYLKDPASYEALLNKAGFTDVTVVDATEECWTRSTRDKLRYVCRQHRLGQLDRPTFNRIMTAGLLGLLSTRYYVLVSAERSSAPAALEGRA